jgi:hypothetical protein
VTVAWPDPDRLDCGPSLLITNVLAQTVIATEVLAAALAGMAETGELTDRPTDELAAVLAEVVIATLIT